MKNKIYGTTRQIKNILKVQDDVLLAMEIMFYFEDAELNKIVVKNAKTYDAKAVLDTYKYFDNCDKIVYLITGDNGYKKEIVLDSSEDDEDDEQTPIKAITKIPKRTQIGGLGSINADYQGIEQNPAGLGYMVAKMENDRDVAKRESQHRQELSEIQNDYKDKIVELKSKIENKEREIKEANEKYVQMKTRCISYKKKFEDLEKEKKSFDSTAQMESIGAKVLGYIMMTKEGGNEDKNMLIGTALLGIAPNSQLPAGQEAKEEEHGYYTALKRLRLESYTKDDFLAIYNCLRMIREKGELFGQYILPVMIKFGYAKSPNAETAEPLNEDEQTEE